MKKLVLNGAAGRLGSNLREPLTKLRGELVSSDIVDDIGALYAGERFQRADLASHDRVHAQLEGADMVVHFGAVDTPTSGFTVAHGVSNNDRVPVDNSKASFPGYRPRDNAGPFCREDPGRGGGA